MNSLRTWLLIPGMAALSLGLLLAACSDDRSNTSTPFPGASDHSSPAAHTAAATSSDKAAAFQDAMRKLWEDHVTWTRLFIVSASADLPDQQATTARLLQNQTDIGNAIKAYYGEAAGARLTTLLNEHITTAAELLTAAKQGDTAAVSAASARWYANADQIAAFLSAANPDRWPPADMKAMMKQHLDETLAEATAHLTGDYAADVAAYDRLHNQILQMADMLSAGIVAQFPDKFA